MYCITCNQVNKQKSAKPIVSNHIFSPSSNHTNRQRLYPMSLTQLNILYAPVIRPNAYSCPVIDKLFKIFCSQLCSELQRKLCRCQGVTMEFSLLFLKRQQRHISKAALARCLKCNGIHWDLRFLKITCFHPALKCIWHALKCQWHCMRWFDITSHGAIIVNNLGNGSWSSIHIWNHRMSFSCLQLVIFFTVIKMFSLDTTSAFEFTDSFISPTLFYIKFLYKFKLHAVTFVPLRVKAKELVVILRSY